MKFQLIIKTKSGKISNHFNAQMTTISIFYGEKLHQTVSPITLLQPGHKTAFLKKNVSSRWCVGLGIFSADIQTEWDLKITNTG